MAKIELLNMDCLDYMRACDAGRFALAIVDPPYGINRAKEGHRGNGKVYEKKNWDNERPGAEYWRELMRVSKNQIIWGANYFTEYLPPSMGWIFWDKGQELDRSDGELAYSSFERALRKKTLNTCYLAEYGGNIHPTEKPVRLYAWLLHNYASDGDLILDTHLGSGSSAIACHLEGFDMVGIEIDKSYYDAACKRVANVTAQQRLFERGQKIIS